MSPRPAAPMAALERGGPVLALVTEPRFAQRLRRYLEEEQLLDARYRLQEVAGGSVALPVLEVAEQRLRELQESGALELPCSLLRIQVGSPIPSKAASVRTPAQKLQLHGQPWRTSILHIEAVKSYAPHVHHIVLDLECRPVLPA
uniref:TYW2 N-terminal domain-containing protein n=1 Tax=Anas platyrhynchos platyrhynchos TaxID=8840 RepID=A0A493TEW5_ANAPP